MKHLVVIVVILMLGILPTTAQDVSQPVRGAELDAMVREMIEWINKFMEYAVSGAPEIIFVDRDEAAVIEDRIRRQGDLTAWHGKGADYIFGGMYDPTTTTVLRRDDWVGFALEDLAMLVHELVHFAQNEAGAKFECAEDEELEAIIQSFDFINDRFGNQWQSIVPRLRATKKSTTCTPSTIPATDD